LGVRRATRDADMLVRGLASDVDALRAVVRKIIAIPQQYGVGFDPARLETVRLRPLRGA